MPNRLEGEGSRTVSFTADPYDEVKDRNNLITFRSGSLTKEINVTQYASDPTLEVDKRVLGYNYAGGIQKLAITSNTAWEIVIGENDGWVTAAAATGTGDGEVEVTVPVYYGSADREAAIILKGAVDEIKIEITQKRPVTVGLWILSEAGATQSTADLAYYDYVKDEVTPKFYSTLNGETLGQVANFMGLYGSKMYVAISGPPDGSESKIRVVDYKTGKLLQTIDMKGPHGEGDLARQMAFHDGKVYVTSYFGGGKGGPGDDYSYFGGVVRIDTVSLSIEAYMRVGDKPEGIAYHNNKLYVCNNETGNGKTMSVVDVDSFEEIRTITVPENPVYIQTALNGDIYFSTLEIYTGGNQGPSAFHKLDPVTYSVKTFDGALASRFAVTDKYIFTGEYSWTAFANVVNRIDRQTVAVKPINVGEGTMFMVYSFDANPVTGEIYIGDQAKGFFGGEDDDVIIMNQEGEVLKTLNVEVPMVNQFIPVFE